MRIYSYLSLPLKKVGWNKTMTIICYRISEEFAFCLCSHYSSISQRESIHWSFCMTMNISCWGKYPVTNNYDYKQIHIGKKYTSNATFSKSSERLDLHQNYEQANLRMLKNDFPIPQNNNCGHVYTSTLQHTKRKDKQYQDSSLKLFTFLIVTFLRPWLSIIKTKKSLDTPSNYIFKARSHRGSQRICIYIDKFSY